MCELDFFGADKIEVFGELNFEEECHAILDLKTTFSFRSGHSTPEKKI